MTWLGLIGLSLFGGLGASARFAQDALVRALVPSNFPWGTVSINVVGSFLLGVITSVAVFADDASPWSVVLASGFCAGYTTFSTAMFDAATLARAGRWGAAAFSVVGTLVLTVGAGSLGIWIGSL